MNVRHPKFNAATRRGGKIGRVAATLVAGIGAGSGLLLATTGIAHAAEDNGAYYALVPASDWLNVAVAGGSTSPGAPIIQWWATGGAEQQWREPLPYTTGTIINENSGMCITTDGVAGDQLYQEPCNGSASQQWYQAYQFAGPALYTNPASGLEMDVSGYAMYAGGHIDAWYENQAPNQFFWSD